MSGQSCSSSSFVEKSDWDRFVRSVIIQVAAGKNFDWLLAAENERSKLKIYFKSLKIARIVMMSFKQRLLLKNNSFKVSL